MEDDLLAHLISLLSARHDVVIKEGLLTNHQLIALVSSNPTSIVARELEVVDNEGPDHEFVADRLTKLDLGACSLSPETLHSVLAGTPNLTELSLPWVDENVSSLHELAPLRSLTSVKLRYSRCVPRPTDPVLGQVRTVWLSDEQREDMTLWRSIFPNATIA